MKFWIMDKKQLSLNTIHAWYKSLKIVKSNDGSAIGTLAASLVILDRLKADFDLNFESHIAEGGAQIKSVSGAKVAAILKSHGETRPFAKEGGRTNRGIQGEIQPLFQELGKPDLHVLKKEDRDEILFSLQGYLVDRVRDFHNRQKIKLVFDPKCSTWSNIKKLLDQAKDLAKAVMLHNI
jgi:hypothetical protein